MTRQHAANLIVVGIVMATLGAIFAPPSAPSYFWWLSPLVTAVIGLLRLSRRGCGKRKSEPFQR